MKTGKGRKEKQEKQASRSRVMRSTRYGLIKGAYTHPWSGSTIISHITPSEGGGRATCVLLYGSRRGRGLGYAARAGWPLEAGLGVGRNETACRVILVLGWLVGFLHRMARLPRMVTVVPPACLAHAAPMRARLNDKLRTGGYPRTVRLSRSWPVVQLVCLLSFVRSSVRSSACDVKEWAACHTTVPCHASAATETAVLPRASCQAIILYSNDKTRVPIVQFPIHLNLTPIPI